MFTRRRRNTEETVCSNKFLCLAISFLISALIKSESNSRCPVHLGGQQNKQLIFIDEKNVILTFGDIWFHSEKSQGSCITKQAQLIKDISLSSGFTNSYNCILASWKGFVVFLLCLIWISLLWMWYKSWPVWQWRKPSVSGHDTWHENLFISESTDQNIKQWRSEGDVCRF